MAPAIGWGDGMGRLELTSLPLASAGGYNALRPRCVASTTHEHSALLLRQQCSPHGQGQSLHQAPTRDSGSPASLSVSIGAFLVGASLRGANLRGAYLRLAKLDGADLSDADLSGVESLTQGQLDRARCNSGTKLPMGLIGIEDAEQ